MMRLTSLQQRLALFLLLPVAVLLFIMIYVGFWYAKENLLREWRESGILRLAHAAHLVDMRLNRPKEWCRMYLYAVGTASPGTLQERLVKRLEAMEGIDRVKITWHHDRQHPPSTSLPHHQSQVHQGMRPGVGKGRMRFQESSPIEITSPHYDTVEEHETVSLVADLTNEENGSVLGKIDVAIRFDYLVEDLQHSTSWHNHKVFLVNLSGRILFCNDPHQRHQLGSSGNPLELETLRALQNNRYGTVSGSGHPPDEISAFFRLEEAPWTLVVIAPGREILAPIVRFRNYYLVGGVIFVIFILLLMRGVIGRTVKSIKEVARAAESVARGSHMSLLPVTTRDEVGQLTESFNTMAVQLEERIRLKEALDLAVEVQQSLLPRTAPLINGLDISGRSIYCDETGGDYFDFLEFSELEERLGVVVGDVAGHGIGAALIMATVRSLVRSRITQPGTLAEVITDVNRLLCLDTSQTASFMTLFIMLADRSRKRIEWVRAGHDPAIIYDIAEDAFKELRGSGVALGVDETLTFHQFVYGDWDPGQIIVIGTDGIWEAEQEQGRMFGKARLRELIRQHHESSALELVDIITQALAEFRGLVPQQDDITLVVLKT